MLHILSDKKRRKFYEYNIDNNSTVLFENDIEKGNMFGFTENYIRVTAKYDPLLVNELRPVRLKAINTDGIMEVDEIEENILSH
jgi:threonylcarbamoyladenosine tRNA methylthiotransferase MtaB